VYVCVCVCVCLWTVATSTTPTPVSVYGTTTSATVSKSCCTGCVVAVARDTVWPAYCTDCWLKHRDCPQFTAPTFVLLATCIVPSSGAVAKFRKATISCVMSVRLSAWNRSASTGRIFMIFGI